MNVRSEALLKMIAQKKIEALFIKIVKHPVFSSDYLLSTFQEQLNQYACVKPNEATCLSPLKLFFEEFYAIRNKKEQLFFDFFEELNQNDYLLNAFGMNIRGKGDNSFTLPYYTNSELQERIKKERETYLK